MSLWEKRERPTTWFSTNQERYPGTQGVFKHPQGNPRQKEEGRERAASISSLKKKFRRFRKSKRPLISIPPESTKPRR